jgi:glycosyltransferase involved in cell wall biosynthesis
MKQKIEQILDLGEIEMVIASQLDMAIYADCFRGIPALFEEAEVGVLYEKYSRAQSIWRMFRYGLTWAKYSRYLANLLRKYQACTVVSDQEYSLLATLVPDYQAFKVIPNFVDLESYREIHISPRPKTIVFTGSFTYSPNYEGMKWFLDRVFPHILAEFPDANVTITGDHGNRPLPMMKNVTLAGFVNDIRELIARSWICVVPIHTGGGTRLKILEALALGTPIVATSKGAEGIDVIDGEHLLIEDDPVNFAKAIIQMFLDHDLRHRLAKNGRKLIQDRYDFDIVIPIYLSLIDQIAAHSESWTPS